MFLLFQSPPSVDVTMSSSRRKEIPSIPVFCMSHAFRKRYHREYCSTNHLEASNVASNSDVPPVFMVDRIYTAAVNNTTELLTELEKVYLLGQSQQEMFTHAVEYAIAYQHISAIQNLFKLDVNRVRHLTEKDVDVNAIGPNVISRAIQGERADVDVLRLLLDLGLDVRKPFGNQGDALMWAVRIGRWELIERILEQRGPSFDVDEVKVSSNPPLFVLPFNPPNSVLHGTPPLTKPNHQLSTTNTTTITPSSPSPRTASASPTNSTTTAARTRKKSRSGPTKSASSSNSSTAAPPSRASASCPT